MTVDVIIPTYKPGKELLQLIDILNRQSLPPKSIILMNTEEKYYEQLMYGTPYAEKYQNLRVYHLSKREFDHGNTRHQGVCKSDAEVVVFMTQDAMPKDLDLLQRLTDALQEDVVVAYARQLPARDCSVLEQFTRFYNYPEKSIVKEKKDIETLGIKTFFCSNVCAAYKRETYLELGGFVRKAIFNEDMLFAAKAIKADYKVAYVAEACVYHSHNYTNLQQLHRNFDLGVSQADHPEVFQGISSESEGKKMVLRARAVLKKKHFYGKLIYFYTQCGFKYTGYLLGKHYKKIPVWLRMKLTMNKAYWQNSK